MLKIDCALSVGSGAVNEDIVGHGHGAAWVIDGATGIGARLLEETSDAAWLARRADRELRSLLAAAPRMPTRELIATVIGACRNDLYRSIKRRPDGPHEHPSAAFAIVRVIDDRVEFATLGDCRIAFIDDAGEDRLFGTTALESIEATTIALVEQLLHDEPGLSSEALREALLPRLRENRRLMNTEGGYWVLGTEPAAAEHLDMSTMTAIDGQRFAIASDGFLRLVELFAVATPRDLLATDDETAAREWLQRLRALEREDGSCARFPRVKVHDDASFLHCEYRMEG